jgi:hypothetical protein
LNPIATIGATRFATPDVASTMRNIAVILSSSIGTWFHAMCEDPLNFRFGDWARLTRDLLFDNEGSLKYKPGLRMNLRKVILPTLVDKTTSRSWMKPLPELYLDGSPKLLEIQPLQCDEQHHEFTLTFGQMQADMRDVAFYFRSKKGIPKLTDSGFGGR